MKTLATALLLGMASVCFNTYAQSDSDSDDGMKDKRGDLRFGLKAGLNVSNVYDEKGNDFVADSKAGFVGGAFLAIPLSKYFGIQPEVLLSQKGFTGTGKFVGINYQFTRTTTHIDVPVLLQFKPIKYVSIVAGPEYSYLTRQVDNFKTEFGSAEDKEEFTNDNIRKNLMGFIVGADLNLGDYFVLSGRVGWDIVANRGDGTSDSPRYKNQWAQVTAGIGF